jgi:hypothetical protein
MAENKKSFLLYCDLIHTVEKMPKEMAGELFLHILQYVNDMNPESDNLLINLTFEPIKQSLKRDLKKYESICERNKSNGRKGGRPNKDKTQDNPKNPVGYLETQDNPNKPKKADSDSDSDSDSDKNNNQIDYYFIDGDIEIKNLLEKLIIVRLEKHKTSTQFDIESISARAFKYANGDKKTVIEILTTSILNRWPDVYPLKQHENKQDSRKKYEPLNYKNDDRF